jgi:type I restriction enzyme S subunit
VSIVELSKIANVSWGDTSVAKKSYVDFGYPAFSAKGQGGFLPEYDFEEPAFVLQAIGARCGKCFKATGRWKPIKNTITITAPTPFNLTAIGQLHAR